MPVQVWELPSCEAPAHRTTSPGLEVAQCGKRKGCQHVIHHAAGNHTHPTARCEQLTKQQLQPQQQRSPAAEQWVGSRLCGTDAAAAGECGAGYVGIPRCIMHAQMYAAPLMEATSVLLEVGLLLYATAGVAGGLSCTDACAPWVQCWVHADANKLLHQTGTIWHRRGGVQDVDVGGPQSIRSLYELVDCYHVQTTTITVQTQQQNAALPSSPVVLTQPQHTNMSRSTPALQRPRWCADAASQGGTPSNLLCCITGQHIYKDGLRLAGVSLLC